MGLFGIFGKKKNKETSVRRVPRTVQQSIPLERCFKNGVIETFPGIYARAYLLEDVNFKIAPASDQVDIFMSFGSFLNTFSHMYQFQFIIVNQQIKKLQSLKELQFNLQRDSLNVYRNEMNSVLANSIINSRNSITQKKYLIVSVEDGNIDHAMTGLMNLDGEINKAIKKISRDAGAEPLTTDEYLYLLYKCYNHPGDSFFFNAKDADGKDTIDGSLLYRANMTEKDIIGPTEGMEFNTREFRLGTSYGRTFFVSKIPSSLTTDFISEMADIQSEMIISLNCRSLETGKALRQLELHRQAVNGQLAEQQKAAARNYYSIDLLSPELQAAQKETTELIQDIQKRDQKLFDIIFTIALFAESKNELDKQSTLLTSVADAHAVGISNLWMQQEYGLNTSLPIAYVDHLEKLARMYTTESASVFIPYTSQEINEKNGLYYGLNQTTKYPIIYSRISPTAPNYNGLIFGEPGRGKSFNTKLEMLSVILRSSNHVVYVIDPEGEYGALCRAMGGTVIDVSPDSTTYINPLDLSLAENDPVAMKVDYVVSMLEIMHADDSGLNSFAKAAIDTCLKRIYMPYIESLRKRGINIDKEIAPTLYDLYAELLDMDTPVSKDIAGTLQLYTTGSYDTFAHRSNISSDSNFVVYNIKNLGTGMKELGLFFCLNDIWNKMYENKAKGVYTWTFIDEFYILLRTRSTAKVLAELWKRARKWNGVPTGIMQNTEDLISSEEGRAIINNTSFIRMLSVSKADRTNLADILSIPDSQLQYITNAPKGCGLIHCGKNRLPFDNVFPKDTAIYRLLSTSQEEKRDEKAASYTFVD